MHLHIGRTSTNGKGRMAAYKGKLSPEQIKALASYISKGLPQ